MSDFLVKITKSLPGLKFYTEIYPTERMVKLLAELYAKVIVFLHETFLYYRRPKQFGGSLSELLGSLNRGLRLKILQDGSSRVLPRLVII